MDENVWSENVPQKCATSTKNTYTCFVNSFSPGMQIIMCHGPTSENPRWRLRPETYLRNFSGYTYIFGGAQSKGRMSDTDR